MTNTFIIYPNYRQASVVFGAESRKDAISNWFDNFQESYPDSYMAGNTVYFREDGEEDYKTSLVIAEDSGYYFTFENPAAIDDFGYVLEKAILPYLRSHDVSDMATDDDLTIAYDEVRHGVKEYYIERAIEEYDSDIGFHSVDNRVSIKRIR